MGETTIVGLRRLVNSTLAIRPVLALAVLCEGVPKIAGDPLT